ncbi:hypothetical protein KP806_13615 [Paenibacillus sp. N4]|uniref:hypothetical protein n=1 Tax=Paenibacillus vietnamensis TaxID=2590547 RepID=UPI001CD0EC59|nr:hypothetical protein [Paenibacillus vietnamensis]MCA0756089.1 hypothetical protein [Paenibacillus vietnamensis]
MPKKRPKRRKASGASPKKRKPGTIKQRNVSRQVYPNSFFTEYAKIMEAVIGNLGDQLMNIEVKLAVQQFLINETIDEWSRKGGFSQSEVKGLYERTYQYWKNDLKEQGKPFAELDLLNRPALEIYNSMLKKSGFSDAMKNLSSPSEINERLEEESEMIGQMKDEMKGIKREFLRQKLEMMKRTLKKDGV